MSQRHLSSVSLLEQCLIATVALAVVAMLSLPAARAVSDTFGWLPFWLIALPLSAWAVARALRRRALACETRPSASVHPISAVHPHARRDAAPQAVRRAA